MSNLAVFGIYPTRARVELAVGELQQRGFRREDISILMAHNEGTKDIGVEKSTKAPEGTATGAASGAVVGGTLGWLVGIGVLAIPGLGPFLAAGPLMALLGGVGLGGTIGGIAGAAIGAGIPEYEAKRYEGLVRSGRVLLSVHADDAAWAQRAKEVLEHTGADHIASTTQEAGDFANSERPLPRGGGV
jgi:hypothetical protein